MQRSRLRRDAIATVIGGALAAAVLYVGLRPWDTSGGFFIGGPLGRDFSNFWLAPTVAIQGRLSLLFDLVAYTDALDAVFHHADDWMVFSYPPNTLLLLVPVALLPYAGALTAWTAANLVALGAAARLLGASGGLTLVTVLSPGALIAAIYGHFGGALALAGTTALRLATTRPTAAGALLALTGAKPQFGVVLALVLLLAGRWRCVAWAAVFGTAIVVGSFAAFGLEAWRGFVGWTLPFHANLLEEYPHLYFRQSVTLYIAGRVHGLPDAATVLQGLFAAAAIGAATLALRRHGPSSQVIAVVLLACVLAPAYGSHYDLAIAAPALAIAFFGTAADPSGVSRPAFATRSLIWLAPAFAAPLGFMGIYAAAPVLAACFLALAMPLAARAGRGRQCPAMGLVERLDPRERHVDRQPAAVDVLPIGDDSRHGAQPPATRNERVLA